MSDDFNIHKHVKKKSEKDPDPNKFGSKKNLDPGRTNNNNNGAYTDSNAENLSEKEVCLHEGNINTEFWERKIPLEKRNIYFGFFEYFLHLKILLVHLVYYHSSYYQYHIYVYLIKKILKRGYPTTTDFFAP